jgi:hypothetical protein
VVVCIGETVVLPFDTTAPTPLLMETEVAPVVVQLNVDCWPGAMVNGLASKRIICGGPCMPT